MKSILKVLNVHQAQPLQWVASADTCFIDYALVPLHGTKTAPQRVEEFSTEMWKKKNSSMLVVTVSLPTIVCLWFD